MGLIKLPEYGKHLVFAGTTGSGKTYLAERMLVNYDSYFAIDTQDSLNLEAVKVTNPEFLRLKLLAFKKIRYVPKPEYLNKTSWDYVFRELLNFSSKKKQRPKVVYIDEIYHVGYGAGFPSWLPKAITTARQRKLSFWISTQRPSQIPMPILSECSKFFIFYLGYEEDIKKMSKFSRDDKLKEEIMKCKFDFSFIEVDRAEGNFVKHEKLKG